MNDKYYAVTAKCGHVGKDYYIPITFAIKSESKKEAARLCRGIPRVKHDHKDAILDVVEITLDEYVELRKENEVNDYLKCKNRAQQRILCPNIKQLLNVDLHNQKIAHSKKERMARIKYKAKKMKEFLKLSID